MHVERIKMFNKSKNIEELLSESCKSASEITHKFKVIGDGDMKEGVLKVKNAFLEKGIAYGVGVTGISVVGIGLLLYLKYKANEKKIIDVLSQENKEIESIEHENNQVQGTVEERRKASPLEIFMEAFD